MNYNDPIRRCSQPHGHPGMSTCTGIHGPFPEELFRCGHAVKVVKALDESSRELLGATLFFLRYSQPHGFAVCKVPKHLQRNPTVYEEWLLHPECLQIVDGVPPP